MKSRRFCGRGEDGGSTVSPSGENGNTWRGIKGAAYSFERPRAAKFKGKKGGPKASKKKRTWKKTHKEKRRMGLRGCSSGLARGRKMKSARGIAVFLSAALAPPCGGAEEALNREKAGETSTQLSKLGVL